MFLTKHSADLYSKTSLLQTMLYFTDCGNSTSIAKKLAKETKGKYVPLKVSQFPDGDIYMQFQTKQKNTLKGKKVVIVHSFQPKPNASLFKVIFAAETAKQMGAKKVILVAPYLAYMRQDKAFHTGECVSSKVMAKLINNSFNKIITIDPHLHRYQNMKEIFSISAKRLSANKLLGQYIKKKIKNPVIIGPDSESYQWAEVIAKEIDCDCSLFIKTRHSSRHVEVRMIKSVDVKGKHAVIVDDIISTGHTVIEAAKKAKKLGAKKVTAICVHGLYAEGALKKLKKAKVKEIISTNSIENKTSKVDITSLLLEELKKER